ncbi:MAG: MFS transporter [Proteobacteria bacterium]|nr:MFS transporter [Pseudomonadota bacterium]NBY19640.1 MFS transporter [bacterium]
MTNQSGNLLARNGTFRNFLAASSISLLGNNIFDIAIPLYIVQKSPDPLLLSWANIALTLPFFLMAPLTGFTVDNFNKRRVMLASDIGQILCLLFLLLYDRYGSGQFALILMVIFTAKTLMITFETVTTFQLVPALVSEHDLNEANSWFLSSQRLIQILGPLTAGLLMSVSGIRSCVIVNMLSFLATLFFVLRLKNLNELIEGSDLKSPARKMTVGGVIDSFIDSIKYVWTSPLFKPFILMMFVWNLSSLVPNTPSIVYYFTIEKRLSSTEYGAIASMFGLVGILGFLWSGKLYQKLFFYRPFVYGALFFATTGALSIIFFNQPYILAVVFALSRIGSSIVTMGTFFLRQTHIPKSKMGGINAALRMFFMSSAPISALLQGFLIKAFNVRISFAVGAVFLWLTVWYSKKVAVAYMGVIPKRQTANKAA